MSEEAYHPLFLEGIEQFNRCEFFEAHDTWEELWQEYSGPDREFYQGLIQVAVCLHHFGNGNCRGAKKLYLSSRGYLEAYGALHHGVNLQQLIAQMEQCCRPILENTAEFPQVELDPELITEIHLVE